MVSADGSIALEIQFIDPPGDLVVGEKLRFRVVKEGAVGQGQNVEIAQLDFLFQPLMWGQVETTDDPYVGLLRVVELVESNDVYAVPDYSISAVLKARGATVLKPRRKSRVGPRRIEVELIFLYGYPGAFERFDPLTAAQPLDPEVGFRLESEKQKIVVRDGKIFLECDTLADLFTRLDCKLPAGDTVSLDLATLIETRAAWRPTEPGLYPWYEQQRRQQGPSPQQKVSHSVRLPQSLVEALDSHPEHEKVIIEDANVPLSIDFLDSPGDLIPGEEIRFKVMLEDQVVPMRHLHFEFHPFVWATYESTADARVGRLRVLDLPRQDDLYNRPELRVEAFLKARGEASVRPRRMFRLIPGRIELELVFYRGHTGSYELFNPLTTARPIDTKQSFVFASDRQRINVRENRLYVQCDRLSDLKTRIDVALPNNEMLSLDLAARIESGTLWSDSSQEFFATGQLPKRAMPEGAVAHEGPEERALRDRIRQLRNFIISFQSRRGLPNEDTTDRIRQRISARVKQTRDALRQYSGPAQQEFLRAFQLAIDSIPDFLRTQAAEANSAELGNP